MAFTAEYVYRILDNYSGPINRITSSTRRYTAATEKARAKALMLSKSLDRVGKKSIAAGRAMSMRLTVPILAVGTAATISFARLEKGLINVNNLLSRQELKRFSGDLEAMQENAVKAGFSIDDSNKGLFDTVSALGANQRAFDTFSVAQKLAIGGATTLGVAVDGLSSIMSVYKDENVSAFEAANALFSAQVKGKTTVEALSANIGKVAPIAHAAGIGYKELLATLSALTVGGLSTEESSTALKGAINALIKPQKEAEKQMRRMGIIYGAANIKSKGLKATLLSLAAAQKKFGLDAIAKAIPNIRALTAVTALSETQLALMDETVKKINSDMKTGDGLMRAFADQNSSMSQKFVRAKGQMTVAFKRFIVIFAPAINKMIDGFASLAERFANLSKPTKIFIGLLAVLLAIIPPLLIGFGMMAMALSAILAITATAGFAAFVAMGIAVAPILAVAAAYFAIAAAIGAIEENWQALTAPGMLKDLAGWGSSLLGGDPLNEAGMQASEDKMRGRNQKDKIELTGMIDVTASEGAKVKSSVISLNAGSNIAGTTRSF
jgi:TP901 family phage tail tape measure protein